MLGSFSTPSNELQGVFIKYFSILLNNYKYIFKFPREFGGNPIPVAMGRELCGYRCGSAKITPRETHVHHYMGRSRVIVSGGRQGIARE